MRRIEQYIDKLNLEYPGWQDDLKRNIDFSKSENEELKNKIYDLVIEIRRVCKEKQEYDRKVLNDIFEDRVICDILWKYVDRVLIYYKAFQPIREKSYSDPENTRKLLEDIFNNFILRIDPEIIDQYKDFAGTGEGENGIERVIYAIDGLTEYYVEHLFTQNMVENDFREETDLNSEICKYYAELYESHFQEIRLNMIMNGIGKIEEEMEQLNEIMTMVDH